MTARRTSSGQWRANASAWLGVTVVFLLGVAAAVSAFSPVIALTIAWIVVILQERLGQPGNPLAKRPHPRTA